MPHNLSRAYQRTRSVAVPCAVVLWADHQTPPLLRPFVNRLNNINQLLLILQNPIELIIITRPEIAHHVLVPEKEHQSDGVVELVHLFEVGDLVDVADVDYGEVLDAVGDLVEHFILAHAVGVPVAAEADDDEAVFFGHDGLVDVPAGDQVGDHDGAHGRLWCGVGGFEVRGCEEGFELSLSSFVRQRSVFYAHAAAEYLSVRSGGGLR